MGISSNSLGRLLRYQKTYPSNESHSRLNQIAIFSHLMCSFFSQVHSQHCSFLSVGMDHRTIPSMTLVYSVEMLMNEQAQCVYRQCWCSAQAPFNPLLLFGGHSWLCVLLLSTANVRSFFVQKNLGIYILLEQTLRNR